MSNQLGAPLSDEEAELMPAFPTLEPLARGEQRPIVFSAEEKGWCSLCRAVDVPIAKASHRDRANVSYGFCLACVGRMAAALRTVR